MSPYQSMSCLEDYYKVYIVNKLMSRHGFFNAVIVTSLYKGDSSWPLIEMISTHHVQACSIIFWKWGGADWSKKSWEAKKENRFAPRKSGMLHAWLSETSILRHSISLYWEELGSNRKASQNLQTEQQISLYWFGK